MKLFVGNCTNQYYDFSYQVPGESTKRPMIRIAPGRQIQIPGDFNALQIDASEHSIVGLHRKYGMIHVDHIPRNRAFTGVCYSVDKPISVDQLMRVREQNENVLVERGQENRRAAAVAVHNSIEERLGEIQSPAKLGNLDLTIEEDTRNPAPDSRMLGEGVTVSRDAPEVPPKVNVRPTRRRARREAA